MNRKFSLIALLALGSFAAHAGVKVTSLDLKTNGATGTINVALDGRSNELPDLRVYGKTIELTLSEADAFSAISKNVSGAQLSANVLNGKVIVKATLPYDIAQEGVNVGWKNKQIEVTFPRGTVAKATTAPTVAAAKTTTARVEADRPNKPEATTAPATAPKKADSKVSKELLNEDYLNKLMKENVARKETDTPKNETKVETKAEAKVDTAKDEIKVQQAAIARTTTEAAPKADTFSFAGYAAKFTIFLAMVLGLFYGAVQLLKKGVFSRGKLGFLNNSAMIEVLSTTYVAPKRSLMVVKAHKQIFLVANSENGIQFLSEMTDTAGLIKEGEKLVTGSNFDTNLGNLEATEGPTFKIKENINESTPVPEEKGIAALSAKDIVKFSDELKKKAKKLRPIEFN